MVGSPDAAACEGDACLVPGATRSDAREAEIDIEPEPEEAAAASVRAVNSALDEGASL
jgi:hypothetical protein